MLPDSLLHPPARMFRTTDLGHGVADAKRTSSYDWYEMIRELEHLLVRKRLAEHSRCLQSHHAAWHLQIWRTSRVEAS